jgi:hypothetical protein
LRFEGLAGFSAYRLVSDGRELGAHPWRQDRAALASVALPASARRGRARRRLVQFSPISDVDDLARELMGFEGAENQFRISGAVLYQKDALHAVASFDGGAISSVT